jgi:type II secretory pathway pseudopilin PulG
MVKVKASTIIETVIAMMIILIVFLVAGTIFLNISKSGLTEKKIKAYESINNYYDQVKINDIPFQGKEEINGFLINMDIEAYGEKPGVVLVHCWISDNENKILAEQKRIVQIK